eukprot:scaffold5017_cov171-Amphora_coffeaeformis.AAC.12
MSGRFQPQKSFFFTVTTTGTEVSATRLGGERLNDAHDSPTTNIDCSDRIIHISNLDWFSSKERVARILRQSIRQSKLPIVPNAECEDDGVDASQQVQITFKEIPPLRRKPRDEGKFHAGSATIAFSTPAQARRGWKNLLQHATTINTNSAWRLRWAPLYNSFDQKPAPLSSQDVVVSPARLALRKLRAARYARRRGRVAAWTDSIIEAVQEAVVAANDGSKDSNGNSNSNSNSNNVADILLHSSRETLQAPRFLSWETSCPAVLDPVRGIGHRERGERKRAAVEAFWFVLRRAFLAPLAAKDGPLSQEKRQIIADLGCGSGNLALPLAWWLSSSEASPNCSCTVRAVDLNQQSLQRLNERAQSISLDSVETLEADIGDLIARGDADVDFLAECDAVVSLHACGAASDLTIASAVSHNLPFAISPCCIGKVKRGRGSGVSNADEHGLSYPRSNWLRDILQKLDAEPGIGNQHMEVGDSNDTILDNYELLASAADYGVNFCDHTTTAPLSFGQYVTQQESPLMVGEMARRKRCQDAKRIIEMDRLQYAVETGGYQVRLMELPRLGFDYPKRQLLLGAPAGSPGAERMMQLPTDL